MALVALVLLMLLLLLVALVVLVQTRPELRVPDPEGLHEVPEGHLLGPGLRRTPRSSATLLAQQQYILV